MKKIQKNDLRIEKEVITALTSDDQSGLKGGAASQTICLQTNTCLNTCRVPCSGIQKTCVDNGCNPASKEFGTCPLPVQTLGENCERPVFSRIPDCYA